jgi:hypothetical protein
MDIYSCWGFFIIGVIGLVFCLIGFCLWMTKLIKLLNRYHKSINDETDEFFILFRKANLINNISMPLFWCSSLFCCIVIDAICVYYYIEKLFL